MRFQALFLVAVALAPLQDYATLLEQGRGYLARRELIAAEKVFREAVELGPQESRGHYYLGLTLLRLGRRQDAIAELERSRDLDGRPNPSVLHELGTAYLQAERLNDAERTLKQAVALAPRLVRLRLQLGWVYYKKVEGEKAAAEFERASELAPQHGVAHLYLGLAQAALGDIESAGASFRRASELQPDRIEAHLGLARTLAQSGHEKEAKDSLEEALRLDPSAAEPHNQLGLLVLRSGEAERAARHFEAALDAEPGHLQACYNLWLVYERLGEKERAQELRARFEKLKAQEERSYRLSQSAAKRNRPR